MNEVSLEASLTDPVSFSPASTGLRELLPPLTKHEALTESARCLMCFDAPCTHACPTHIDIPRFIKKISTGNLHGSARTILDSNLLGATCARVCPVQELCEGACVLGAEHKPIAIGRLQRFAMDYLYSNRIDVFTPAKSTGKKVAVVGAGPAGLSCAGELAKLGHSVTLYERRELGGGLSTYGIKVFPAAILGGLDSIGGAVLGGIIIGLLENVAQYVDSEYLHWGNLYEIAPFYVLIIILMIKPYGLFGTKDIERV